MLKGFHHVGVTCQDLERSKEFFAGLLGGKLLYDAGTSPPGHLDARVGIPGAIAKKAVVKIGDSLIELVEYRHPKSKPKGLSAAGIGTLHLAIEVDKGWVWCYFNSPDGHQLELVENRRRGSS